MDEISLVKKAAADKAVEFVKDGMVVGLGTGSTAEFAIKRLGERVSEGLKIKGVPSSVAIHKLAEEAGIDVISYEHFLKEKIEIDLDIDGADRVDPEFNLIKGGGGAHVREKVVANASKLFYVVVDETKMVGHLAGSFPIAVEVWRDHADEVMEKLGRYGDVHYHKKDGKVFISDNSNYILDVSLRVGEPITGLEVDLDSIPGVVDNGLFTLRKPDRVFVGYFDGRVETLERHQ